MSIATAVLCGALVVGSSVRGSLQQLALEGLGQTTYAVTGPRMFHESLAERVEQDSGSQKLFDTTVPLMLLNGALESADGEKNLRAGRVSVIGYGSGFWAMESPTNSSQESKPALKEDIVLLTTSLAKELGVKVGDEVLLRIPLSSALPLESILGKKDDTVVSRRLKVQLILEPKGLARFQFSPSQLAPRNAFVPLSVLQHVLKQEGKVNTLLFTSLEPKSPTNTNAAGDLQQLLQKHLSVRDVGLRVQAVGTGKDSKWTTVDASDKNSQAKYFDISSEALALPGDFVNAFKTKSPNAQPVITYLANTITVGKRKIPYSTISGVDSTNQLGPLLDENGKPIVLKEDEIALNSWAAKELKAKLGDEVTLKFYEPESTHGELKELPPVTLKLVAIVPLKTSLANGNANPATDKFLFPQLKGVTDQSSISDWDVPFPLTERIGPKDDAYWDDYGALPKAFVSFSLAKKLWSSRFGAVTSIRIPATDKLPLVKQKAAIETQVANAATEAKLSPPVIPVRELLLKSSSGATPFDMLFLGFSMFLIGSALMLVALLFHLGVAYRAKEIGLLSAVGIPPKQIKRMLLSEATIIAAIGSSIGILLGIGYAWLMLWALKNIWIKAIVTPFLELHFSWITITAGWVIGILSAIVPCWLAIRAAAKTSPTRLLAGDVSETASNFTTTARKKWSVPTAIVLILSAVGLSFLGIGKTGEAQAGCFFGAGASVLTALILLTREQFRGQRFSKKQNSLGTRTILRLAKRSVERNPGKAMLCVGLVASTSFLLIAISAFRLGDNESGRGGFTLMAESSLPLPYDLATDAGRVQLGLSDEENDQLADMPIFGLRLHSGDDASCLNLYQTQRPRVLAVSNAFVDRGGFAWAGSADSSVENPWTLLKKPAKDSDAIPVVLDADTAAYALKVGGVGSEFEIDDPDAGKIKFQIVGLLAKSLLQGSLLVSVENFLKLYPANEGSRIFLIDTAGKLSPHETSEILESRLGDFGFDAMNAKSRLAELYAVQNTYLSTFQSLGGLGLLLGTFGLAAVQLRNVVERRGELALLRAVGFNNKRIAWMLLAENAVLLLIGLGIGIIAAIVSVLPHWVSGSAEIPLQGLAWMLFAIACVGVAAGGLAVRSALRAPIIATLRNQ